MNKKVITLRKATMLAKNLKSAGKKIIFTNGCFDLIHAGHVTYLEKAKKYGDVLILGLNSDASIKQIKGDQRPILGEKDRALLLSAFNFIDYIIFFNEATPIRVIKSIKPDIHIKGGDYRVKDLPEYPIIKKYGGVIKILPYIKGCSTTSLIEKIKAAYC